MAFDPEPRIGWIHNLAVQADLRGQGLGRRLIEHALDRFRAAGMTVARIETLEQNAIGRQLYPSIGFLEVARQIHFAMALSPQPAVHSPSRGATGDS
jgi:ribosomal protein S18 acetylase RimI-like enzyme